MARSKRVNGDAVMMLVSTIAENFNLAYTAENIPQVLDKLPDHMRTDEGVKSLVTSIFNG